MSFIGYLKDVVVNVGSVIIGAVMIFTGLMGMSLQDEPMAGAIFVIVGIVLMLFARYRVKRKGRTL